jgi:hypothetical protein
VHWDLGVIVEEVEPNPIFGRRAGLHAPGPEQKVARHRKARTQVSECQDGVSTDFVRAKTVRGNFQGAELRRRKV